MSHIRKVPDPAFKNLLANWLIRFGNEFLSIEDLEYFLHSRDRDVQVGAVIEIFRSHSHHMKRALYDIIVKIDDKRVREAIDTYFFFLSEKEEK